MIIILVEDHWLPEALFVIMVSPTMRDVLSIVLVSKFLYELEIFRPDIALLSTWTQVNPKFLGHVDNLETEPVYGPNGELINGTGTIQPVYSLTDALMKEMSVENDSHFIFRLNVYRDGQFNAKFSPAEFPLVKHFKERVYLGVETMTKLDYQYIFTQACWATPDADPARWINLNLLMLIQSIGDHRFTIPSLLTDVQLMSTLAYHHDLILKIDSTHKLSNSKTHHLSTFNVMLSCAICVCLMIPSVSQHAAMMPLVRR